MKDTIYRQAAIDAINAWIQLYVLSRTTAGAVSLQDVISALPSAQPEIIRCKDCKYYLNSNEKCALIDTRLNFYATDKIWNGDCFCSWAERKTDE